jgi:hypothetical protein
MTDTRSEDTHGGTAIQWVPFASRAACEQAEHWWNERDLGRNQRTRVTAKCHDTGVRDK